MPSAIWEAYTICPKNVEFSICRICKQRMSRGGSQRTTTPLWQHLKSKHPSRHAELWKKKEDAAAAARQASKKRQTTLQVSAGAGRLRLAATSTPSSASQQASGITEDSDVDDDSQPSCSYAVPLSQSPAFSSSGESSLPSPSCAGPAAKRRLLEANTQSTITEIFEKQQPFPPGHPRAVKLTRRVAAMICKDNQPLSIVENRGFRELMEEAVPRYTLPSRKTLSTTVIPEMYRAERERVRLLLEEADHVGATTDFWSSTTADSYLALTVHFLDRSFTLQHLCLECVPFTEVSHTAGAVSTFMKSTFSDWGISDKVACIMRDNAANMNKGLELSGYTHRPCMAHTLQLVLKDGLLGKEVIEQTLQKCRNIVKHFKHSNKAIKVLNHHQERLGLKKHCLIQDEPTRWNSQLHMVQRLVQEKDAVLLATEQLRFRTEMATSHWELMEEAIKVLEIFDRATFKASTSHVTIAEVIPMVNRTILALKNHQTRVPVLRDFIKELQASMVRRFGDVEKDDMYAVATLLDPRFKAKLFSKPENAQRAKASLLAEMSQEEEPAEQHQAANIAGDPPNAADLDAASADPFYTEIMVATLAPQELRLDTEALRPQEELDIYLSEPLFPGHPDSNTSFQYWEKNTTFPTLKRFARKYLVSPPSTVMAERLFSTSGLIVDRKRSRLDPQKVRMLVFLNKNLQ